MASKTDLVRGQLVFDEQNEDAKLVVVFPDADTIGDQDMGTANAIMEAEDNQPYDLDDDTPCTRCVYVGGAGYGEKEYTFPTARLDVPDSSSTFRSWDPAVWAQASLLVDLWSEIPIDDIHAMSVGLPGKVILCAKEMALRRGISFPSENSGMYRGELHACPECESDLNLAEPIESAGDGVAYGYLSCMNEECEWEGAEEWHLVRTENRHERDRDGEGVKVGEPTKAYFGDSE